MLDSEAISGDVTINSLHGACFSCARTLPVRKGIFRV